MSNLEQVSKCQGAHLLKTLVFEQVPKIMTCSR
nr:MAG TPA: hypothetical protein [Caudoviricetes sp.]